MTKESSGMLEDVQREFTEEELQVLAAQLRKPDGDIGVQVGERMNTGNAAMNLHTLAVLAPQAGDNILEIGMGTGHFVKNILLMDGSIRYTGCDYSELMVKTATEKNQHFVQQERASFVHGNARELPFNAETFSKVFTVNTLYFWDDHDAVLQQLKKVLRPDGVLILSIRPKENMDTFPVTKYNFASFAQEDVEALLQAHGFAHVKTTHIKEPPEPLMGKMIQKETLIVAAWLQDPNSTIQS